MISVGAVFPQDRVFFLNRSHHETHVPLNSGQTAVSTIILSNKSFLDLFFQIVKAEIYSLESFFVIVFSSLQVLSSF